MIKFSILLPTYNCEDIIEQSLESISWADEILVVDSFSNDNTLDIVKKFGVRIIQHEYINSAKQKNWALKFISHDWVLQIDSDETLEKGLKEELKVVGCAGIGLDTAEIRYGKIKGIIKEKFTQSPQCLIVPGKLHFIEEEVLELYKQ